MFSTGPKYVGLDGQPVASRPSFWDELLGYKPQYQTAPTTSDAGAKTTKTRRPGKAK